MLVDDAPLDTYVTEDDQAVHLLARTVEPEQVQQNIPQGQQPQQQQQQPLNNQQTGSNSIPTNQPGPQNQPGSQNQPGQNIFIQGSNMGPGNQAVPPQLNAILSSLFPGGNPMISMASKTLVVVKINCFCSKDSRLAL